MAAFVGPFGQAPRGWRGATSGSASGKQSEPLSHPAGDSGLIASEHLGQLTPPVRVPLGSATYVGPVSGTSPPSMLDTPYGMSIGSLQAPRFGGFGGSASAFIMLPPRDLLERFVRIVGLLRDRLREVITELTVNAQKVALIPEDPAIAGWESKAHWVYYNMDKLVQAFLMLGFTTDVGPSPPPSSAAFHNEVGRLLDGLGACTVSRRAFVWGLLSAAQKQINARAEEREAAGVDSKTNESEAAREEAVLEAVKESLGEFTDLRPR